MASEKLDEHPWRTLALFLLAGAAIFTLALSLLLGVLVRVGGHNLDSTVVYFYPLLAGAGALFGLERWMAYESGGVNPFHEQ